MNFDQLVSQRLHPILSEHGLIMTSESKNIVRYESERLVVVLSHDPREISNTLWLGRKENEVEINNDIVQLFFGINLKLAPLSKPEFVENVYLFFSQKLEAIVNEPQTLKGLEKFLSAKSEDFTNALVEKQHLEVANKAWEKKDYGEVLKHLSRITKNHLSSSSRKNITQPLKGSILINLSYKTRNGKPQLDLIENFTRNQQGVEVIDYFNPNTGQGVRVIKETNEFDTFINYITD